MTARIPTLLFDASGNPRWQRIALDTAPRTVRASLRAVARRLPARTHANRYIRYLLQEGYAALSYVLDWRDAFVAHPELDVRVCNINDLLAFRRALREIAQYPLIVVMHSAAGDNLSHIGRAIPALQARTGKLVVFFGNEYDLIPEKIDFAQRTGAEFIATQLPIDAGRWLYADCARSEVIAAPAALNADVYRPGPSERPIDIGFRGDPYGFALGDIDRTRLIDAARVGAARLGLRPDIAFTRVPRERWRDLLQSWHGIVGAESGTAFLEKDDRTRRAVRTYLARHPQATFDEVRARFFRDLRPTVSGKAISSRHFEPIGTKTCQVLLEGRYNGILQADQHYISVRGDLADLDDALRKLTDASVRRSIVERAYEHVLEHHTYKRRVRDLVRRVLQQPPTGRPSTHS